MQNMSNGPLKISVEYIKIYVSLWSSVTLKPEYEQGAKAASEYHNLIIASDYKQVSSIV